MTKHTPGPWRVEHDYKPFVIRDAGGNIVATITGTAATWPHAKDNAHLIAAAPELLAALEEVDLNLSEWKPEKLKDYGLDWILDVARAAIAKARRE